MIEPKEVEIVTQAGVKKTFVLSKFPALIGREIICKYPMSGMPKLGDYAVNEETALKLLGFTAVKNQDGSYLQLTNRALVDNHAVDWETLVQLEWAMLEYNTSFFQNGKLSGFLDQMTESLPQLISKILTDLLPQLSKTEKPHSMN